MITFNRRHCGHSLAAVLSILSLLVLSACGGGGGGGGGGVDDTSISASTTSLTFAGFSGSFVALPAQTITINFRGDGVVAGTLPGQTLPAWLYVNAPQQTATPQALFTINAVATPAMAPGTYTTTIRFATGHADGTFVKSTDITITLKLTEPFWANAPISSFTEIDGDPQGAIPSAGITVQILGGNIAWRAVPTQPWIVPASTSGNVKGELNVKVSRQSLGVGSYSGQLQIIDDISGVTRSIPITYSIRSAKIVTNKSSLSFAVGPATVSSDILSQLQIGDDINGVNSSKDVRWTASTNLPWLQIAPLSGRTSAPVSMSVSVDASRLATLASATHKNTIDLAYTDGAGATGTVSIPVTLTVRMPLARSAVPYLIQPLTATTVLLRGEDMQDADLASLQLDGVSVTSGAVRQNSSSILLSLPALSAGEHRITFANSLGLSRSKASVTAKVLPVLSASMIATANNKRIVFDAGRTRLYAIDRIDQEIERYQWTGSSWSTLSSISVTKLRDAALSRNGAELIIMTEAGVYTLDAENVGATPILEIQGSKVQNFIIPSYTAVMDTGVAVIGQSFPGSGHTNVIGYDSVQRAMITSAPFGSLIYEGHVGVSEDGRYAVVGGAGLSPAAEALMIDSRGSSTNALGALLPYPSGGYIDIHFSRDGSKILENYRTLRNPSGLSLGPDLPSGDFARLSLDGTKAYIYFKNPGPGRVEIYDISVAPYTKTGEISLVTRITDPLTPYLPGLFPVFSGLLAPDNKALLISGNEGIAVVPLP